jgi:hypothetical protein
MKKLSSKALRYNRGEKSIIKKFVIKICLKTVNFSYFITSRFIQQCGSGTRRGTLLQ